MIINYTIEKPSTIKEYIIEHISRNFYGHLKSNNAIYRINGLEAASPNTALSVGDELEIEYGVLEPKLVGLYSDGELEIVYEDESFIVIDKQPHVLTIPAKSNPSDSVYNRLLTYFKGTSNTVHVVNRLDKETTGLVLVCKNKLARALLADFDKTYYCQTDKLMPMTNGTLKDSIGRGTDGIKRVVDPLNGEIAITHYELIDHKENDDGTKVYSYRIKLDTGRTHQIRVHFSYYRCPLLGDELYGGTPTEDGIMRLTCREISFVHPFTHEKLSFKSRY